MGKPDHMPDNRETKDVLEMLLNGSALLSQFVILNCLLLSGFQNKMITSIKNNINMLCIYFVSTCATFLLRKNKYL